MPGVIWVCLEFFKCLGSLCAFLQTVNTKLDTALTKIDDLPNQFQSILELQTYSDNSNKLSSVISLLST